MTLAWSFPVIPNICHTTLAGMHGHEALTRQFLHAQVRKSGLIDYYRGVHAQVCLIHADRRVKAEISGLPLPFRTEQL